MVQIFYLWKPSSSSGDSLAEAAKFLASLRRCIAGITNNITPDKKIIAPAK